MTTQAFSKLSPKSTRAGRRIAGLCGLQNLIDWCVLTALIDRERLVDKIGWNAGVLADAEKLPHEVGPVPKEVPAMVNIKRMSGSSIIGLIAGGVTIHPGKMVSPKLDQNRPRVASRQPAHRRIAKDRPTAQRWWWD